MADSACFWDHPWHRRIRPVSHAVRKCILDTLHGSLLRRGGRLCHYPDVHFPLLARFDNTIGAMFKNALFIGVRFLFCTALMAVIYFVMLLIVVRIFTPAVIFGEGLCALLLLLSAVQYPESLSGKTEDHAGTVPDLQ